MFTDTTNAPKIMLTGYRYRAHSAFYIADSTSFKGYYRDISSKDYEFRGLTYAAADSIAATYKSKTSGDSIYDAYWARQNDAGMYLVHVTQQVIPTAWTADT